MERVGADVVGGALGRSGALGGHDGSVPVRGHGRVRARDCGRCGRVGAKRSRDAGTRLEPCRGSVVHQLDGEFPGVVSYGRYDDAQHGVRVRPYRAELYARQRDGGGERVLVFNDTAAAVTVNLTQPRDLPSGAFGAAPSRVGPSWSADLRLTSRDADRRIVEIGVSEQARVGFDAFDLPLPPPPPVANYVDMYVNTDHEVGRLARSVQAAGPDGMEWVVTVRLPDTDGTLAWSPDAVPDRWDMTVEAGGARVNMRERGSLRLGQGSHLARVRMFPAAPSATRVLPNYPNPFNPETWIPFELQSSSDVVVRIYRPDGSLVRALNLGLREPGYYTGRHDAAYWDGRNEMGESVGSGVYFYDLRAGDYHATRRMVILK